MSGRVLTWLIPVLALVVPGFLFYNWWSTLNAQSRSELEKKVRSNPGMALFMGGKKDNMQNPLATAPVAQSTATVATTAASTATAVAVSSGAAPVAPQPQAQPLVQSPNGLQPQTAPPADANGQPGNQPGNQPGAQPGGPGTSPSQQVASAAPVLRDPTLSPFDIVKLKELEEARLKRAGEIVAAERPKLTRPKEPPVENSIDLQGIVEVASGNKAIINGDMVGEGDIVLGKVKVLKITPQVVTFSYRGRKFEKTITQ